MNKETKLNIYQGMIQYLLESTNYTLRTIAAMSNTPIKTIKLIYNHNQMPKSFPSEMDFVKLFEIILEINLKSESPIFIQEFKYENLDY